MTPAFQHTLLVVDDEPDVCDSVHDLLRKQFKVLKAKSAAEGSKLMETEEVHIIMTDQRMPQVTGVELLKKIRAGHPKAVRMLFWAMPTSESIIMSINQGTFSSSRKSPGSPKSWRRLSATPPRNTTAWWNRRCKCRVSTTKSANSGTEWHRWSRNFHAVGGTK